MSEYFLKYRFLPIILIALAIICGAIAIGNNSRVFLVISWILVGFLLYKLGIILTEEKLDAEFRHHCDKHKEDQLTRLNCRYCKIANEFNRIRNEMLNE